jgi:thiamine biosynthesis lipoprotein
VLLAALALAASAAPLAREARVVMGTLAEVRVGGLADPLPALDAAFDALDGVDQRMSLFRESELVRLNREGTARASAALQTVLAHALDVARASRGAFDPTVGRLAGRPAAERRRMLAAVGWQRVRIEADLVTLAPGTALDLGGIAKGYAVDLALGALRDAGASAGLVDLGGSSLGAFGAPLDIAVRDPGGGEPWAVFRVEGGAVGTSGADQRGDHVVDPRSGEPARRVLGATVVAASAMEADALSTALYVLGVEEGLALLARRGASGFVLVKERGRRTVRTTPGFAARFGLAAAPDVAVAP